MPYFLSIVGTLKRLNKLSIYACFLVLAFAPPSFAQKLLIYTDDWAPYNFKNNDEIVGISTEIIKEAMAIAGVDYEIIMRPWARSYKTVTRTPNTALFTIHRSDKRESLFKWAGPIVKSNIYLYKLQSRADIEIRQFSDLRGFYIGALNSGAVHQHLLSKGLNESNLHAQSHADNLLNLLFAERVDLIPGDELDLQYQLKNNKHHYDDLKKAFFLYDSRYYIAFNKEVPNNLIDKVQEALNQLHETSKTQAIVNHYIETSRNVNNTLH